MASVRQAEYHVPSLHLPGPYMYKKKLLSETNLMSSWELCVRCVFISIAFYVGFLWSRISLHIIAQVMPRAETSMGHFFAGILTKKKANPQNW